MTARKANAIRSGGLLEQCVYCLVPAGFSVFENARHFEKAEELLPRYVVRNWAHPTLYGTKGKKEALVVAATCASTRVLRDESGLFRCVLEAKFQASSGSVDEKLPYIYEACLSSPIPNWLVVCGGTWWKKGRGTQALIWLRKRAEMVRQRNKRLIVFHQVKEFSEFVHVAWGSQG